MPMVVFFTGLMEPRPHWPHAVRVVEPDKPVPVGIMQAEGVAQSVRTLRRRLRARNLKFEPITLFEVMHAAVKRQQKLKRVLVRDGVRSGNIIS